MWTLIIAAAHAVPADTFHHQGRLIDAAGGALNGQVPMVFELFDTALSGDPLHQQAETLGVQDGYYTVQIGPVSDEALAAERLWIQVTADGNTLQPRSELTAVPFAARAADSNSVGGVVLQSPNGSCIRLSLEDGRTEPTNTPIHCDTGEPVGLSVVGGGYLLPGPSYLASCVDYLNSPVYAAEGDGAYWIDPDANGTGQRVWCDMTGGGWTLAAVNTVDAHATGFYKTFAQYASGFGDIHNASTGIAWLGLEAMHHITKNGDVTLKVVTNNATYNYPGWNLESAATDYIMRVPSSDRNPTNADQGLRYHHGYAFTTWDNDNDVWTGGSTNCAVNTQSGWWFRSCWWTQWGADNTSQTYWNESSAPQDQYSTLRMWLR